jgi:hypothetical protein
VNRSVLEQWLPGDTTKNSLPYAKKLQTIIQEHGAEKKPWFALQDLIATASGRNSDRACPSFSTSAICALLERHGEMNAGPDTTAEELKDAARFCARHGELETMQTEEWPEEVTALLSEIVAVQSLAMSTDVTVEVTGLEDAAADGDIQDREDAVARLYHAATGNRHTEARLFPDPLQPEGSSPRSADAGATTAPKPESCHPRPELPESGNAAQRAPQLRVLRGQAPRVSPPELDEKPVAENTPGYIPMAFPKLFPFGTGDFHDPEAPYRGEVDFGTWGRTVLQWHDQRFMRHTRFRYWFLNTWLRMKTPGMRQVFFRTNANAADLTLDQLSSVETRRKVVQQMATAASNIPGTMGERRAMRQKLESLVDQKEAETVEEYETLGRGRLPAAFSTLTCAVYKWSQLHDVLLRSYPTAERLRFQEWRQEHRNDDERCEKQKEAYYRAALANPGVVEWYCALRLEMSVHLLAALLTQTMTNPRIPGSGAYADFLRQEMRQHLGDAFEEVTFERSIAAIGRVDDYWASYEWSAGGMVHVHVALWITGSPRVDKVLAQEPSAASPDETDRKRGREILLEDRGYVVLTDTQCANLMGAFYDKAYAEWHPGKDADGHAANAPSERNKQGRIGERKVPAPEMVSHDSLMWLLGTSASMEDDAQGEKDDAAQREAHCYGE